MKQGSWKVLAASPPPASSAAWVCLCGCAPRPGPLRVTEIGAGLGLGGAPLKGRAWAHGRCLFSSARAPGVANRSTDCSLCSGLPNPTFYSPPKPQQNFVRSSLSEARVRRIMRMPCATALTKLESCAARRHRSHQR